jgi:beta-glucosidase
MLKIRYIALALAALASPGEAQSPASSAAQARVDSLLARMTLEEKVGQMTQLTLYPLLARGPQPRDSARIDLAKLRAAIVGRHIGSILNVHDGALTVDGWHALLRQIQDVALKETRLGIPILYGIDAVHGANYTQGATIFPHNLALAATFHRDVVRHAAEITAAETRASGIPWNFAPVLDIGRQPLWGRFYETFGEDPYLASELGRAAVIGMQRNNMLAATAKHYLGYSMPTSGHDRTPALLSERAVREYALPPFRAAVAAGVGVVMVNSGEIDGEPLHASRYWLTDVLRGELGFKGVVVSDWEDVNYLHSRHRVAANRRAAVQRAVEAGIDMSMTPYDFEFADHLLDLVRTGAISKKRVDDSVRRILALKAKVGLFDAPYPNPAGRTAFGRLEARAVASQAARESVTLLKNDGTLPLKPATRILVTGPAATSLPALYGGWTFTWQGNDTSRFQPGTPTLLDAIRRKFSSVTYVPGSSFDSIIDVAAAAAAARNADVAILVLGESAYAEGVGDVSDLTLPDAQRQLAEAIQATGVPTVLVLLQGRPRIIRRIADRSRAILMGYWPGAAGADAISDVLLGAVNPSGRLPFTYPHAPNALLTYDHKFTETFVPADSSQSGFAPEFEFGTGLSYTRFEYADLQLSHSTLNMSDTLTVEVTVRNTGERSGREVVLLFTRQHYGSLTPAVRRLRGFDSVTLMPGAAQRIRFRLLAADLAVIGRDGRAVVEPGAYDINVGGRTGTFQLRQGPAAGR